MIMVKSSGGILFGGHIASPIQSTNAYSATIFCADSLVVTDALSFPFPEFEDIAQLPLVLRRFVGEDMYIVYEK